MEKTDVVVVGGGQAGIAMSEHLSANGLDHVVFEKHQIADRWRNGRWDSLVANGPSWHDRLQSREFTEFDDDAFVPKDQVADYLEAYAAQINAPIRCGVAVTRVSKSGTDLGFVVETSAGSIQAKSVIAATGPFHTPVIPPIMPADAPVRQMHSFDYKNPNQLEDGGVLVIGAGSSGVQVADELMRAGTLKPGEMLATEVICKICRRKLKLPFVFGFLHERFCSYPYRSAGWQRVHRRFSPTGSC